jgi:hypothetical protein
MRGNSRLSFLDNRLSFSEFQCDLTHFGNNAKASTGTVPDHLARSATTCAVERPG